MTCLSMQDSYEPLHTVRIDVLTGWPKTASEGFLLAFVDVVVMTLHLRSQNVRKTGT